MKGGLFGLVWLFYISDELPPKDFKIQNNMLKIKDYSQSLKNKLKKEDRNKNHDKQNSH